MKKIIFIFGFFPLINLTYGQTFSVGNTCCNYNLVNKTFAVVLTPPAWPNMASDDDQFLMDIDGDVNNDIVITRSYSAKAGGNGFTEHYIEIKPISNVEFVFSVNTSSFCTFSGLINNLNFGTSFSAAMNWTTAPSVPSAGQLAPLIYSYYSSSLYTSFCGQVTDTFFVGFRKILPTNDTIYGWINLDPDYPLKGKIRDYAYTCGTYTAAPQPSTITTSQLSFCKGDSVLLSATPGGGVFYGTGVYGSYFKTKNLAAGIYTVYCAIPNPAGCTTSPSSITFTVTNASITNTKTAICSGESLTLTGTPLGGNFSGTYVSGNVFSPTGSGTFTASYTYTNSSGCNLTASVALVSNPCVGVQELFKDNRFNIFPNPNSGEFEIKGIKEETIFISNELGQLIETKNLNAQNNYSAKISNLQSGVYFVGNKFSRQKIVIIK